MSVALPIHSQWNGAPAEPGEHARVTLSEDGDLIVTVDAPFHGDPAPSGPPGPRWALWEHEVVELFILGAGEAYTEIELGPHGHHLVLKLQGVRNVVARELPLQVQTHIEGARWRAIARVPRAWLPEPPYRANAYAIHGQGEARRYLAHAPVPGEKPDFHRLQHFIDITIP